MYESGYYPLDAEHNPNAPYNQIDSDSINVDCCISCSLSKDVTITTSDHIIEKCEDWDIDDEGNSVHIEEVNYDYSNCNFNKDYHHEHYSIPELLEQLEMFLLCAIENLETKTTKTAQLKIYKQMLKDCQGWTLDEEEVVEA